ncbi:hypothetical protein [Raoultibacter phocaeensis]|uniref:hypothetical protein n=1 Tax=Raoultibacter phocaeensis TaxID=2479841 RepID=UPI00111A9778|nr:hypothetical protein [Raoultibacter phocaeensis]
MAWWEDVKASAVVIRHDPLGAGHCRPFEYYLRQAQWEGKGGIDRAPTEDDMRLARRLWCERELGDRVDYATREGRWAGKGDGLMADASLWGQHGPLSKEAVVGSAAASGSYILESLVAVKRSEAGALGIATKRDFERMMRATWTDNVMRWGVVERREDVRWAAAYHTDARQSVHVHVFTWSAAGDFKFGTTVGRKATFEGGSIVRAYAMRRAMEPRNEMQALLRDAINLKVQVLVGARLDAARWARVEAQSRRLELEPARLMRDDLDDGKRAELDVMRRRLASALEGGSGALSRNRRAVAIAKDIHSFLARNSPGMSDLRERYRQTWEVSANIKGYSDKAFVDGTARFSDRGEVRRAWDRERVRYIDSNMAAMRDRAVSIMLRDAAKGNFGVVDYSNRLEVEEQLRRRSEELSLERSRIERRARELPEEGAGWKVEARRARETLAARESLREEQDRRLMSPAELSFRAERDLAARTGLSRSGCRELVESARAAFALACSSAAGFRDAPADVKRSCEEAAARIVAAPAMQRRIDERAAAICCSKGIHDLEAQHAVRASGERQTLAAVAERVHARAREDPFAALRGPAGPQEAERPDLLFGVASIFERYLRSQHDQELCGGTVRRSPGMDARWSEGQEDRKALERGLR